MCDIDLRLKGAVFESRVTQESDGVLTILDVDQSPCPPMLLRPRPKSPGVLDDFLESTVNSTFQPHKRFGTRMLFIF
jgi:hypothetical protein